jgi:RHS repeat-associated protein
MRHIFVFLFQVIVCIGSVYGQGLSGPDQVIEGTTQEYQYFDDVMLTNASWNASGGVITAQWQSGNTYYCTVTWTTTGLQTLSLYDGAVLYGQLSVQVDPCTVNTPSTSFTYSSNSTSALITRTSNPSGAVWYWQTVSNGTSTVNSTNTYSVASGSSYYLRAKHDVGDCWSTNSLVTATIPGNTTVTPGSRCGTGTVNLSATVGSNGTTVRWYGAASGGSVLATGTNYTTPSLSTTTTYYACTYNATTGAEGIRMAVTATVTTTPSAGGTISSSAENNSTTSGTITLTGQTGNVIRWEMNTGSGWSSIVSTNTSLTYANPSYTSAQYRAVVQNGACTPAYSNIVRVERKVLGYGNTIQLTAESGGSYQWYKSGVVISGATQQTYTASDAVVYTVKTGSVTTGAFFVQPALVTQAYPVNAVNTIRVLKPGLNSSSNLFTLLPSELSQQVNYLDGLGRMFQTVAVNQSPMSKDIIAAVGYGRQGLLDTTYLPYVSVANDGRFRLNAIKGSNNAYISSEQYQFYQSTSKVAIDAYPFARTMYRNTPDAKVTEQGAPGADWQPGQQTIRNSTTWNSSSYPVKYWKPNGTTSGNYADNSVIVSITTDENNNQVRTYTNTLGQTVLKQVQEGTSSWLDTYYIYDEFGRLKYQVPPKALAVLGSGTDVTVSTLAELIYTYVYDSRGRVVEKKVPGAAVEYLAYDKHDRIVLTQNGNLRTANKWMFIKYDRFNRPVYSGIYLNATQTTRAGIQGLLDAINYSTTPWYEVEQVNATYHGYSNNAFPTSGTTLLNVNYYDHYDFDRNGAVDYKYDSAHVGSGQGQELTSQKKPRGLPTGSKRVLFDAAGNVTTTWLVSVVHYDLYDRPIQTLSSNHLNTAWTWGTMDRGTVVYDFAGKVLKSKTTHYQSVSALVVLNDRTEYDHAGRVLKVYRKINSDAEQLLCEYVYNALGQVVDKKLHHTGGGNYLQSVDFRYNIRGWLMSINNAQLLNDGVSNDDTGDYFGMELVYNTPESGMGNTQYYNGNVSALKWKGPGETSGATDQHSYKYSYDKSDRLTTATFQANTGGAWTKEAGTLNEAMTYDGNGNITSLVRNQNQRGLSGLTVTSTPQPIDNLTYTYTTNTNILSKVEDAALTKGFANGTVNGAAEYTYNPDGSLNKDDNKGISSVTYNILGKVQVVNFSNGKKIEYVYDAAGTKVTMKTYQNTTLLTCTNYAGSFVYEGSTPVLSFFGSPEGRVVKNGSTFEYQYAIADHQGNTRVVFSSVTPAPVPVTATMEASTNADFQNYVNRTNWELFDKTDPVNDGTDYSQKLTGGSGSQVGVAKSYKVYAGDKVKIEAYAKYYNAQSTSSNLSGFALALTSAFGVSSSSTGEALKVYNGLNSYGSYVGAGGGNGGTTYPKAFVNILVFDKEHNFLDAAWQQIDGGEQVGVSPKAAHDYMVREYTAKEEGYVYVFVSNENPTLVEVYFDDVVMTHTKGNVVQYNEYYPFGLQTANSWTRENTTGNNFLGNGGTELNQTTSLYDLEFRNFDPVLGRMNGIDPMASKYGSLTPYNYSFNNPATFNDPSGADPYDHYQGGQEFYFYGGQYTYDDVQNNRNLGQAVFNDHKRVYRDYGHSLSFGLLEYSAEMREYASGVKNDAKGMNLDAFVRKYGEEAELYENYLDFYNNGVYHESEFTGYSLKVGGKVVWNNFELYTQRGTGNFIVFISPYAPYGNALEGSKWNAVSAGTLDLLVQAVQGYVKAGGKLKNLIIDSHGSPGSLSLGYAKSDHIRVSDFINGTANAKKLKSITDLISSGGSLVFTGCLAGQQSLYHANEFLNSDRNGAINIYMNQDYTTGYKYNGMPFLPFDSGLTRNVEYGWLHTNGTSSNIYYNLSIGSSGSIIPIEF